MDGVITEMALKIADMIDSMTVDESGQAWRLQPAGQLKEDLEFLSAKIVELDQHKLFCPICGKETESELVYAVRACSECRRVASLCANGKIAVRLVVEVLDE